jgi:hypothetical protein
LQATDEAILNHQAAEEQPRRTLQGEKKIPSIEES